MNASTFYKLCSSVVILLCFGSYLGHSSTAAADPNEVTFDRDGTALVSCACILATSACVSKLGDALAGKERHTWSQTGFAKQGVTIDLSAFCMSKRDVEKLGEGLCCYNTNDEHDVRFFWGELVKINQ